MALTQVTTHGIKDATVATADISNDSITSAKIISNSITSSELANGAVTNTEVASDAAIAGSKISPDFGSQDITTTGHLDLPDNSQLKLGNSQDLKLYHDGSHSVIEATNGTGNLYVKHNSQIFFQNSSGNESHIVLNPHGSVELYYDNSKKFETLQNGVKVTGIMQLTSHLDMGDSDEIKLGDDNDFSLYHAGGNNYIEAHNTSNVRVVQWTGSAHENLAQFIPNGAVELYYDNSKKFETTSSGISVTGGVYCNTDGVANGVQIGAGNDLILQHNGTNSFIDNNTGDLYIQTTGSGDDILIESADDVTIKVAGSETAIQATGDGAVDLYYDNSKKLETASDGILASGAIRTNAATSGAASANQATFDFNSQNARLLSYHSSGSSISAFTNPSGGSLAERFRIDADGHVLIPVDSKKLQIGASQDLALYHDGSNSFIDDAGTGYLRIRGSEVRLQKPSSAEDMLKATADGSVRLYYDNSIKLETLTGGVNIVGSLTVNGSAISGGGISNIVEDTTPQLGGALGSNGNNILMADNDRIKFGTGQDLNIYHDGSNSYVSDSGTGDLRLSGNVVKFNNSGNTETMVKATENGNVLLYHDNAQKFRTYAAGVEVTGNILLPFDGSTTSNSIQVGASQDLKIYHDGTNNRIDASNGHIYLRVNGTENAFKGAQNGEVELSYDGSKKLETTSSGVNITGELNLTDNQPAQFGNSDDLQVFHNGTYSFINNITSWLLIQSDLLALRSVTGTENYLTGQVNAGTELYYDNAKKLETESYGVEVTGHLGVAQDSSEVRIGGSYDLRLYHDGSHSYIKNNTGSLRFLDGTSEKFRISGTGTYFNDGIFPQTNNAHNIGSADLRFVNLFMSNAIDLQDSAKVQFGNSDDFQLYHDGSNSYIVNDTAALFIRSDTIKLRDADNNEDFIECFKDGGVRLYYDNVLKFYTDSTGNQLNGMQQCNQGSNNNVLRLNPTSVTYNDNHIKIHATRGANSGYNFCGFDSGHGGTADREFTIRGDGNAYADGTWNNNGADYAEFFESSTGSAIAVGTTVVLENNKVRAATSSDAVADIIGVVRPKEAGQASMTIGNTAWNKWQGKYLTDDFDRFILDEHNVIEWTDADGNFHNYESHAIPSDVNVPSEPTIRTQDENGNKFTHYRLNPNYNPERTYLPRHDRDEWVIIGLVGQVKVLKGQAANDRWIKMRDVSDTVQEYFIR